METWIWISLYVVQTLVGAVLWRKYVLTEKDTALTALVLSCLVFPSVICGIYLVFRMHNFLLKPLYSYIDYLAGVKNKTEEK